MNGFLLDTNVFSETTKPKPNRGVVEWLKATSEEQTFVSAVTFGEIRRGIERLGVSKRKAALEAFLITLVERFARRTIPIDETVAQRWGRLVAAVESSGKGISVADALIAASAIEHNLTIVSRDADYFAVAPVSRLNPFT